MSANRLPDYMAGSPRVLRQEMRIAEDDAAGTILALAYNLAARVERGMIAVDAPMRSSRALPVGPLTVRVTVEVEDPAQPLDPAERRMAPGQDELQRLTAAARREVGAASAALTRLGSYTAALGRLAGTEEA